MGRRALPKIDPNFDFSDLVRTPEELTSPWDPVGLFGREAPVEIELGCGKGLFMQAASKEHPEKNFLGIEIRKKYAAFCAYRLKRDGAKNALMVSGDGLPIFKELLPDNSIAAIHVYFPDPWWKAKHHHRRVMNEDFIGDIHRVLTPGGVLHFWTDVHEYFEVTLELMAKISPLCGPFEVPEPKAEHDFDYRTHYERRMRQQDKPVWRSQFHKEK